MTVNGEKARRTLVDGRYVRYKEGAKMYSMGLNKFQDLAKEAGATIKCDKVVLVDRITFEEYLESFRE